MHNSAHLSEVSHPRCNPLLTNIYPPKTMKRYSLNLRCQQNFLLCILAAIALPAHAATYYWDTNPSTAAAGNGILEGGVGAWNITTANFTTDSADAAGVNHNIWSSALNAAGKDTVIFGGAAGGAITLNTFAANVAGTTNNLLLNNLTFNTTDYVLAGTNQIRFVNNGTTGGSITVAPGVTATINNAIQGAAAGGFTAGTADGQIDATVDINGGGTLKLGGGNGSLGFNITGNTTVEVTAGSFSGFNLTTVAAGSTLRATANGVIPTPSSLNGDGSLDLNGTTQTMGTLGGNIGITNASSTASNTLSLSYTAGNQTYTGAITNGAGKISLAVTGAFAMGSGFNSSLILATQTFAGANTFTGSLSLGRATTVLDFSNAAAPASNIFYNTGFGTPTGDDGKLIISKPLLNFNGVNNHAIGTLANLTLTGKANATNSQAFNGFRLDPNAAALILLNPNATANTVTLDLGAIVRSSGSVVNFATTNATTVLSANATIKTTSGTAGATLVDDLGGVYATLGGRDWAAKNGANDALVPATYTDATATTLSGTATTVLAGGPANDVKLAADTTIVALRYANGTARSGISLDGRVLTTGGILISNAVSNSGNFIANGTLKPVGTDLVVLNYAANARMFGLRANIDTGLIGDSGLTTGGTTPIQLMENNTFGGAINVQQNGLIVTGTNTPSAVNVNGSTAIATGAHLPGSGPNTTFLQLGNANATGSIGSVDVNLGVGAMLAIKRTDAITLNNNIRGIGGVTQGWSGTTTMTASVPTKYGYVGDTTVTAGALKLDYTTANAGIISDSSRLVLGGGTVEYATDATTTHNDAVRDTIFIPGASTITKSGTGAGRLRLNALSDVAQAGSSANFTAASIADTDATNTNGILGSRARFTVGSAGVYDWAVNSTNAGDGAITGYTGYTALNLTAGTDTVNSQQALTGMVALTGTRTTNTLNLTNSSGNPQSLDLGAANTLTLTAGGLLVTGTSAAQIDNGTLKSNTATNSDLIIHQYNPASLTINAVVANGAGASTLTKVGSGPLTLTGTNTYTGVTFLTGGTTNISSNANLGAVATGAAVNMNNATLHVTADVILSNGAVGTNNRNVVLNGIGGTMEVDSTRTLTVGGLISGPGGLTKTGDGVLDLRNTSYTGPTIVNAGTLKFGGAVNPVISAFTVVTGATLDIAGLGNSIGSLEGGGIVTNSGAAATFSVGGLNTDTTFSGQLTNGTNAMSVDKYGAGTLTLTSDTNNYTGATTISGGTLALAGVGLLPANTNLNVSSRTGTFDISAIGSVSTTIGSLAGSTGSSVVLGGKDLNIGGTTNANFAGVVSGTGTLTKNSTSTQTLSGPNTYDGVTTITKGVLAISHNSALGSTAGNTVINSNGRVDATGGGQLSLSGGITIAENFTVQGTGDAVNYQKAIASTAGTNTINGVITLTGNPTYRIGTLAGTLNLGLITRSTAAGGALVLDPSVGSTVNVNQAIDNNGGTLTAHAGGTVVLTVSNNDIGNVTVQNSTTLRITANDALGLTRSLTVGQGAVVNGAAGVGNDVGTFDLGGVSQTIGALIAYPNAGVAPNNATGPDRRLVTNTGTGNSVFTVGNGGGTGSFNGTIQNGTGTVALTKTGAGTQTIDGVISYTGDTTINNGTLALGATTAIPDAGTVRINGATSILKLTDGVTDVVAALFINGTSVSGTWGSSTSTADNKDDVHFTGTGVLSVSSDPFSTWAQSFGLQNPWLSVNPALNGEPTADPDGDGFSNFAEYAFGLVPTAGSPSVITEVLNPATGLFSYTRRKPSLTNLTYVYEWSNALTGGTWTTFTPVQTTTNNGDPIEVVTPQIPASILTANPGKLFLRVRASQ